LSLLCGSLRWLYDQDHVLAPAATADKKEEADDEPDWLKSYTVEYEQKTQQSEHQLRRQELQARIDRARKREELERRNKSSWTARQNAKKMVSIKKKVLQRFIVSSNNPLQKTIQEQSNVLESEDAEFVLDEYDSDETGNVDSRKPLAKSNRNSNLSANVQELLRRYDFRNRAATF
jgi:hypothetical protein